MMIQLVLAHALEMGDRRLKRRRGGSGVVKDNDNDAGNRNTAEEPPDGADGSAHSLPLLNNIFCNESSDSSI